MAKKLKDQVVVITGASSGIGRATALHFGKAGAKLVLAARNEVALHEVADEVDNMGAEVIVAPTDVSNWEQVEQLARDAITTFGRIDTWINDAGVGIYAMAEETSVEETHQIMETNFMGVVHGVKAALPYMKAQQSGTIINLGSVESQRALPYHSAYSASKHAIKAYTEALRMELEYQHSGIHVTLILPAGINTPFFNHSLSKLGVLPQPAPPVYKPELVAQAIAFAAEHPQRDIYVGGASMFFWIMQRISPRLTDKFMTTGGAMFKLQKSSMPDSGQSSLFNTIPERGRVTGDYGHLVKPSMYTPLFEFTPQIVRTLLPAVLLGGLVALVSRRIG
jgi:short-subunit dehydrogenase